MSEWGQRTNEQVHKYIGSLPGPQNNNSDAGFLEGIISGGAGVLGGIADFSDSTMGIGRGAGDYFNNVARRNARTKDYTWTDMIPFASDYYTNPQGFSYGFGQQLGSSLPLMLAGGGVGGLGAKALTALGGGAITRALGGSLAKKAAGAGLFSAPFEAASEGGNLYRNMTTADPYGKFGFTDQQGRDAAQTAFWRNLPILAAGNMIEGALLGGAKLPGMHIGYGDGVIRRAFKGAAMPGLVNGLQEGTTEALQEGITGNLQGDKVWDIYNSSTWGNPLSEGQKMAAAEAFLGSGLMGGAPGAYRGVKSSPQMRVGNDVEDYNGVDSDVKDAANAFGKHLYDNFKIDPTITSGRRSAQNNAAVNGAKNSWHLKGRAVDLDVGDISDEQAEQIRQDAEGAGWGEVLYHDAGSGKHLHLADYQGGAVSGDAANMSDAENKMWSLAQRSSQKTGIPAEVIYGQWYHESGGFDSQLARENNNFAGITQVESNDSKQPDGGNFYKSFSSPEEFEEYYSRFITKFKGASEAKNAREFAQAIHDDGYFTDSVDNYVNGMEGAMKKAPKGNTGQSEQLKFKDIKDTKGIIDWAKEYQDTLDDPAEINWIDDNISDPKAIFNKYPQKVSDYLSLTPEGAPTEVAAENSNVFGDLSDETFLSAAEQRRRDQAILSTLHGMQKGGAVSNSKGGSFAFDGNFLRVDPKLKYRVHSSYKSPVTGKRHSGFTPEVLRLLRDAGLEPRRNIEQGQPQEQPQEQLVQNSVTAAAGDYMQQIEPAQSQAKNESAETATGQRLLGNAQAQDIDDLKGELRTHVLNGNKDEIIRTGEQLLSLLGQEDTMQVVADIQKEVNSVSRNQQGRESKEPAAFSSQDYGRQLLDTARTHGVPANNLLSTDLQKGTSAAIKMMERRLLDAGIPVDSSKLKPAKEKQSDSYGKLLLEAAKEHGVKADYKKLENHVEHGVKGAMTFLEDKLAKAGIDVEQVKARMAENMQKEESPNAATEVHVTEHTNGLQLVEGYQTQSGKSLEAADEREFIVKPDGSIDFGEITPEIEKATNGKVRAGKIRLQVGHNGFGLVHIKKREKELKKIGYGSAEDYVNDIASNFNEIYPEKDVNRFLLIKRDKRSAVMPVDLELTFDGEKYYAVISAIPMREKNLLKKLKEESPIYSKHLQGLASVSNDGAVSGDNNSDVGVTVPKATTAKSNNSSITNSIPQSKNNTQENRFGSEEEAAAEILKAFGLEKPVTAEKAFNVIDDSDEALQAALDEFNTELHKLSANPMFNPKLMTAAFKVGMIHLQRGLNTFAEWSKSMLSTSPKLKPFLPSVWDAVQAYPKEVKFDENKMMAVMRYVGTQYDKGITDKAELKKQLENMIGKEYAILIEPAYAGITKFPTKEEVENEHHDSTGLVAERTGEGDNKNQVGTDDGGEGSGGRGGQAILPTRTEVRPQRSVRVRDDSAASSGEAGNRGVQDEESTDRDGGAGSEQLPGGVRANFDRQTGLDSGRTGSDIASAQNGRDNAADQIKKNKVAYKAGSLESVKNDLPMLLPEQQEDVVFAECRLLERQGAGVMFTNGTGAGKTFIGLGIVKRFVNQGKTNILITSPKDTINQDWVKAGDGFFDLQIAPLQSKKDSGKGVSITTFANLGDNNELTKRAWDLIIVDESHDLMGNADGKSTRTLDNLRALTFHERGLHNRFRRMHAGEYEKLEGMDEGKQKEELANDLNEKQKKAVKEWQAAPEEDKPKVVFLSATPFSHVNDIDYAEGYLFDYPKQESTGYNVPNGKQRYMQDNFGHRMRHGKLTKPEGSVDDSVYERQFHENLRKDGALSGRTLTVDHDYDRGFILVDGGIGNKIDEGFEWLSKKENGDYDKLIDYLNSTYKYHDKMYLLEAIKAREAINLVKQYKDTGKKVVVFHDFKKGGATHPFKRNVSAVPQDVVWQYRDFAAKRPDLINLNLSDLKSPIDTFKDAFRDDVLLFNGNTVDKEAEQIKRLFNDDNSGKDIILVTSDKGQAGISLHDQTGKCQRVLINLGMPTKPVTAIQVEGRIYRVGQKTNAIFRYLNTGTTMERTAFASKIAERAETVENLSLGNEARNLRESFIKSFEDTVDSDEWKSNLPGAEGEGTGGRERDRAARSTLTDFDRAKSFYYGHGKKTRKNKSAEGTDYFATPEPLGLKMVEWADINPGEKVLEPSAGHGAISRWFAPNTENVMVEPSGKLATSAQMSGNGTLVNGYFEDYYIGNKFDAVVMNPPFGTGGKTAIEHVAKAFKHLRDGGRIVAIIPDGPSCQKHFEKWFYGNDSGKTKAERDGEKSAVLVKEIGLPGVVFKNAGTQVNCKVLVIDKQETQAGRDHTDTQGAIDFRGAKTIEEFFDRIENTSSPKRYKPADAVANVDEAHDAEDVDSSTEKESNFTVSEHKHTKTGEMIPCAVFKERVDDFKSINSLAKRHGGYYSSFSKGFLFANGEAARSKFIKEADALLSGKDFSQRGPARSIFDGMEFLNDDELTAKERMIQAAGEKFGVPVVFFKAQKTLDGFHGEGMTFLNRDSERPVNWVFWHESFHWLKNNNSELYHEMLDYVKEKEIFSPKQIADYRINNDRMELTDEQAIEEMMADHMPDVARRVGLMKELGKENPSLAEKFVAWVRDMMDRFHEFFINKIGVADGMTDLQKKGMIEAFSNLARDMVDADGRRLFEVKYGGKIYLRKNGKPAAWVLQDTGIAYSQRKNVDNESGKEDNGSKEERFFRGKINAVRHKIIVDAIEKVISKPQLLERVKDEDGLPSLREKILTDVRQARDYRVNLYNKLGKTLALYDSVKDMQMVLDYGRWLIVNDRRIREKLHSVIASRDGGRGLQGIIAGLDGDSVRSADPGGSQKLSGVQSRSIGEIPGNYRNNDPVIKEIRKEYTEASQEKHAEKGAFLASENDYSFSRSDGKTLTQRAVANLARKVGLKVEPLKNVHVNTVNKGDRLGIMDMWVRSPSEIAKKHPIFAPFFKMAVAAVEKQEGLRNHFGICTRTVGKLLKAKEDLNACTDILLAGDREQKEFSVEELKQAGLSEKAIQAYKLIRKAMKETYTLVNNARQQVHTHSTHMSSAKMEELQNNKFAKVLATKQTGEDEYLVTYKSPKTWKKADEAVTEEALEKMKENPNIQITKEVNAGDGLYRINYIEQIAPLADRGGYIPHFFHEYMIIKKGDDESKVVASGKTLADAVEIANAIAANHHNDEYIIRQKGFKYDGKEREIAAIVGDQEFEKMSKQVAKHTDMTIKEASAYLKENAGVALKSRHRFYGNAMHRKGAEGFETDLMWILNHHFNTASRYVSLEEHFKPRAISLFERLFGRFDKDYSGNTNAQYAKDYINDVNGNPTAIENKLNEALKNNPYFQSVLGDSFGDRPALQISSGISGTMAKAKLGFLNASSALLNLTQFLNIVGRLNSYSYAMEGVKRAFHPTELDQHIIEESGVLDGINIAADGGGYTQSRGTQFGSAKGKLRFAFKNLNALMDKGMFFFTKIDALMRKAAVLGAYHQAIRDKGYKVDEGSRLSFKAMQYAKEVNREANFDYGAHDAPNIIRRGSVLTQNALQFQKFPIKQLEFMWNISHSGSKKQLYKFWLPYMLIAGLGQFPFADWADELISMITGGNFKPKVDGKKALMEWAGKDKEKQGIANIMMYGGLSAAGIDISQRAGMGNNFNNLSLTGPAGSTVSGMLRQAVNGNPIETIKAFSPGIGNMLQATAGETRTTRHRVGSTYEGWERVLKAAGFRTIDEAVSSDMKTISLLEADRKKNRDGAAIDAYIKDPSTENFRRLKELKIKPERVQAERKRKRMSNSDRTIDNMSKEQQANLKGMVDFTK